MGPDVAPAVVLVEGASDRAALEVLAERRGGPGGVTFVELAGYTNVGRELRRLGVGPGAGPAPVRVAGLFDGGAETYLRRALRRAGVEAGDGRASLAAAGFFLCDEDLEDELIRAVGTGRMLEIVEAEGELASLRLLRRQPAQRDRDLLAQLRRFLSSRAGRKERYAPLLTAAALAADRVPAPLAGVLDHAGL